MLSHRNSFRFGRIRECCIEESRIATRFKGYFIEVIPDGINAYGRMGNSEIRRFFSIRSCCPSGKFLSFTGRHTDFIRSNSNILRQNFCSFCSRSKCTSIRIECNLVAIRAIHGNIGLTNGPHLRFGTCTRIVFPCTTIQIANDLFRIKIIGRISIESFAIGQRANTRTRFIFIQIFTEIIRIVQILGFNASYTFIAARNGTNATINSIKAISGINAGRHIDRSTITERTDNTAHICARTTSSYAYRADAIGNGHALYISSDSTDSVRSAACFNRTGRHAIFNFTTFTNPANNCTHRNRLIAIDARRSSRSSRINLDVLQGQVLDSSCKIDVINFFFRNNAKQPNILGISSIPIFRFRRKRGDTIILNFRGIDVKVRNGKTLTIKYSIKTWRSSSSCRNRDKDFSEISLHVDGLGQLDFCTLKIGIIVLHLARNPRQFFRRINLVIVVSRILGGLLCQEIAPTRASCTVKSKSLASKKQANN